MKPQKNVYVSLPSGIPGSLSPAITLPVSEAGFLSKPEAPSHEPVNIQQELIKASGHKPSKKLVEKVLHSNVHTPSPNAIKDEYSYWLAKQKQQQAKPKAALNKKQLIAIAAVLVIASSAFALWKALQVEKTFQPLAAAVIPNNLNETSDKQLPGVQYSESKTRDIVYETKNAISRKITAKPVVKEAAAIINKKELLTVRDQVEKASAPVASIVSKKVEEPKAKPYINPVTENIPVIKPSVKPSAENVAIIKEPVEHPVAVAAIPSSLPAQAAKIDKPQVNTPPLTSLIDVQGYYVSVSRNGISACDIVINNRSNALLKLAAVDVYYLDRKRAVVSKKTLYFSNVQPKSKMTIRAVADTYAVAAEWQLGLVNSADGVIYYAKQ